MAHQADTHACNPVETTVVVVVVPPLLLLPEPPLLLATEKKTGEAEWEVDVVVVVGTRIAWSRSITAAGPFVVVVFIQAGSGDDAFVSLSRRTKNKREVNLRQGKKKILSHSGVLGYAREK